ncbi:MAG: hypothetical protein JSU87_00720 [Gemmatimonadota bacterium]|nr:MAG: hypothetical protein JSU87_00720 [Gemmatimonadota bacterium]
MRPSRVPRTANARSVLWIVAASTIASAACAESREPGEESAAAAAEAPGMDVCGLVTAEQIEEALSQQPGEPTAGTMGPSNLTCVWPAADGSNPRLVHLLIGERTAATYEEYLANARQQMGDHFRDHALEKVEGIGDFAVFASFDRAGLLQVFAGNHLIQVSAGPSAHRSAQQNCMKLARTILSRIG